MSHSPDAITPGPLRGAGLTRLAPSLFVFCLLLAACATPSSESVAPADGVDPTVAQVDPTGADGSPTERDVGPSDAAVEPPGAPVESTGAAVEPEPTAPVPSEATAINAPDPAAVSLALEPFAELDAPIAMAVRPRDPMLYVAERAGTVRPVTAQGVVGAPVIDISDLTTTAGERGLLGLAWSPDAGTLYLSFTDVDGANILQAVDVVDGVLRADTGRLVLRVEQPASNHNGGDVHVGPDGYVWWALGDGGASDDRFGNGQRPDTLLATLLRLDPDGGDPYAIPPDNPFLDGDGAPEVWAYGLRNPWRFSFDADTGDLWVADVGQNAVEEINRVAVDAGGLNYGWPRLEGNQPFDGQAIDGPSVQPVHTYDHGRGCSITGGRVYRGVQVDQRLRGAYLYGDFCAGDVFALAVDADGQVLADVDTGLDVPSLVSFGEDADGEIYVLSLDGPIMKVVPG